MTHLIDKPGIWNVTREQYDADPVIVPSLSNSIAKLILEKSPAHARLNHPRLNSNFEPRHERKFDLGNAFHALMLGEGEKVVTLDYDDFKKPAAREARDAAIDDGKLPLLTHVYEAACEMMAAARRQLDETEEGAGVFLADRGKSEVTIVWEEEGTWFRIRPDWVPKGGNVIWDLKTTAESANPERWVRTMYNVGGDTQPPFYINGMRAVTKKEWHWRWVVIEITPPYALSICAPSTPMLELGNAKIGRATAYWRWCMAKNKWPAYSRETAYLEVAPWEERRLLDRLTREAVARESGPELIERAIAMYAPDGWKDKAA